MKPSRPKFFANASILAQVLCYKHYIFIYLNAYLTNLWVYAKRWPQKIPPPPKPYSAEINIQYFAKSVESDYRYKSRVYLIT